MSIKVKLFEVAEEYNSHNTERLDVEGMKKLLMKLEMFDKYKRE